VIQVVVFWFVTPCSDVVECQRFGRTDIITRCHNPEDRDLYAK